MGDLDMHFLPMGPFSPSCLAVTEEMHLPKTYETLLGIAVSICPQTTLIHLLRIRTCTGIAPTPAPGLRPAPSQP